MGEYADEEEEIVNSEEVQDGEDEALFEDLSGDTLNLLNLFDPSYDGGMFDEDDEDEDIFATDDWDLDLSFDFDEEQNFPSSGQSAVADARSLFTPQLKSKSVNYEGVSTRIKQYIDSLPEEYRDKLVVTSGRDGSHAKNSKHYLGNAVDLRYNDKLHSYVQQTAKNYGLQTMNPFHGTAPHTHLEVMQNGGYTTLRPTAPNFDPQVFTPEFNIDYLNQKFENDVQTVMNQGAESIAPTTNVAGSIAGAAGVVEDISSGVNQANSLKRQINKTIFDTANSTMDSAISLLGQQQQNQEMRRLAKQRADSSQRYQSYTPQIKNIPIYT